MFSINALVLAGISWTDILRETVLLLTLGGNIEDHGLENSSDSVRQFLCFICSQRELVDAGDNYSAYCENFLQPIQRGCRFEGGLVSIY